jgi:hypothetical protein
MWPEVAINVVAYVVGGYLAFVIFRLFQFAMGVEK